MTSTLDGRRHPATPAPAPAPVTMAGALNTALG